MERELRVGLDPASFLIFCSSCSNLSHRCLYRFAEHLDEAAARVEREAFVLVRAASPCGVLVEAEVSGRVHHSRIENLAPERTLTSSGSFGSPNFLPLPLQGLERGEYLLPEAFRKLRAARVVLADASV